MPRPYTISLDPADVFQILDALESRATAYEKTVALINGTYKSETDEEDAIERFFVPEECEDSLEAEEIANHFRSIITKINNQISGQ